MRRFHGTSSEDVRALFLERFQSEPAAIASAPGRVNLIGEHLDYNGGEVLPIGIELRTWVAVGPASDARSHVISADETGEGTFDAEVASPAGDWSDYVAGVARELLALRISLPPFELAVKSDLPRGGGLSSSAALEVASATALLALAGEELTPPEVGRLAQRAEANFVGVPCGIMDQFASALSREGHALHLRADSESFGYVPMPDKVLVFDTGVPRSLRSSDFALRQQECRAALTLLRRLNPGLADLASATVEEVLEAKLPEPLDRRARHVVEEVGRVQQAVEALTAGRRLPGELLLASHESLRSLFECSIPELDWFVERMMQNPGVTGARLTGAGWGGCAIASGSDDALLASATGLEEEYGKRFAGGSSTWLTRATGGPFVL